jgi:hypothetical protein
VIADQHRKALHVSLTVELFIFVDGPPGPELSAKKINEEGLPLISIA